MGSAADRFEEYEIKRIVSVLKDREDTRDLAFFVVGLNTGYRVSELLWLDIGDVAFDGEIRDRIYVPAEIMKGGKKPRAVPINAATRDVLDRYLGKRTWTDTDEALWSSQHGGRLTRHGAWSLVKRICKKAGLPADNRSPHSLRKAFGWRIYQSHGIRAAQVALGHEQVTVTENYLGVAQAEVDEVIRRMNIGG